MRNFSSVAIILALLIVSSGHDRGACLAQTQKEAATITGRVKLDGKPAPGITVIAAPSSSDPAKTVEQMFNSSASLKATTDSDGVYRLEGVPAGKYHVAVSAPALVNAESNSGGEIVVADGTTTDGIDFALSLGGVITGKITDSDGRPVIGERVSLKPLDTSGGSTVSAPAAMFGDRMYATDDRGIYRIFGLRAGRYLVSAGKESDVMSSFLSQRPKRIQTFYPSVTDETKAKPVQVTAGSEATGVDIQFSAADKGFVVSGRVVDSEKNTPIANAMVGYSKVRKLTVAKDSVPAGTPDDVSLAIPDMPGGFTTTNEKGEFRFATVAPGSYTVEATSIGALAGSGGSQFYADPVAFEVQSANVDKLDIKVHRGTTITGVVIVESADSQDSLDRFGQLMMMAMVTDPATRSNSSGNCVVAADGSFRLGGLKPGKVTLRPFSMSARRPGILRIERNNVEVQGAFEIQADEEITGLRVILTPAIGTIRGRVTIQGGVLQPGARITARVRLQNSDSSADSDVFGNESARVSPNGTFAIESLTPGSYELEVFATIPGLKGPRGVSVKQTVVVTAERPTEVDVVLDLAAKDADK